MIHAIEAVRRVRIPGLLLAAAFAMFAVLVLRVIAVESPVMASDEYAYFMAAKYDHVRADVYKYDPAMQAVGNEVYPIVFNVWEMLSAERTAMVGRVFNALLYVLSSFVLFAIFARSFDRKTAVISAILYLLFPFSFYAITLLPEVMFQFCVYLIVLVTLGTLRWRAPLAILLPAAVAALAYFIKPHALAVIAAVAGFYFAAPLAESSKGLLVRRLAWGLVRAVLFLAATALFIYLVKLLSKDAADDGQLVGSFYASYLSRLSSPAYLLRNLWSMLDYVGGHLALLLAMFTPGILAIAVACSRISKIWRRPAGEIASMAADDRQNMLALMVGLLAIALLLMIAAFTNAASETSEFEKYRLHGRYLAPLLPLLLGFSVWAVGKAASTRLVGVVSLASLAFFVFYLRFQYHIYPWDYPDAFVFFTSKMTYWGMPGTNDWLVWLVFLAGIVFAASCIRGRLQLASYVTFLVVLMLGSHVQMANWLRTHSQSNRPTIEAADAIGDYLGPAAPGTGLLLVADRYGKSSYFLMELASLQHVQSIAPGGRISASGIPGGVTWLVAPGDVTVESCVDQRIRFGDQALYMLRVDAAGSPVSANAADCTQGK
jgi:hypothetical protein